MAGLLEFAARFGTEERCIVHLAELRWPGGLCVPRLRRTGGLTAEGTSAGLRVRHLPSAGFDGPSDFNRRNLPDGLHGYLIRRAVECATITYHSPNVWPFFKIVPFMLDTSSLDGYGCYGEPEAGSPRNCN